MIRKTTHLALMSLLLASFAAVAFAAGPAVLNGTFVLNVAKSTYPGGAPKSETRVYTSKDGRMSMTATGENANGTPIRMVLENVGWDGKDYPIAGLSWADTISVVAEGEASVSTFKSGGKVVARQRRTSSSDGKTVTFVLETTGKDGKPVVTTSVFEKK